MARILGLDVGEKTIGVALSDESGRYAFEDRTIWRQPGKKRDMAAVRELVERQGVAEIVVGLPLTMEGERQPQTARVEEFIAALRGHVRIPIRTADERLTTWEAEQALMAAGVSRTHWKQRVDSMAARLILQAYLDASLRRRGAEDGEDTQRF